MKHQDLLEGINALQNGDEKTFERMIENCVLEETKRLTSNKEETQLNESVIGGIIGGAAAIGLAAYGWKIFQDSKVVKFLKENYSEQYRKAERILKNLENVTTVEELDRQYNEFTEIMQNIRSDVRETHSDHPQQNRIIRLIDKSLTNMEIEYENNRNVIEQAQSIVNEKLGGMQRRVERWHRMNQAASSVDEIDRVEREFDNIMQSFDEAMNEIRNLELDEKVKNRAIRSIESWKKNVREQLQSAQ